MIDSIFLDAHLHLQDARFSDQLETVIEKARNAGVNAMYCNATCEEDWEEVLHIADNHGAVIPFVGIHPWFAGAVRQGWNARLDSILQMTGCGIGEIGLDKRCGVDLKLQSEIFTTQLQLAGDHNRPMVIHCVKCWGHLLSLLENFSRVNPLPPVMVHSFNGSREIMQRLVTLGCYLSFSPAMTSPIGGKIKQVFQQTPLEHILLETDAPNRMPAALSPAKEITIEPANIPILYRFAAAQKSLSLQEFCSVIWNNGTIFTSTTVTG